MKILLAEDDFLSSEIIKENLQNWGYEVHCVYSGSEAWQALQDPEAPKLVILDWQMPDFTGIDICKKVRARDSGSYTYIIMLTGLTEKAYVLQGLEAGVDDYLTKPCNPQELRLRLLAGQRILSLETELLFTLKQMREFTYANNIALYDTELIGRELEILRLIVAGQTDEEIAQEFHLSPDWVKAHLANIIQKMQVTSREEVILKARQDSRLQQNANPFN